MTYFDQINRKALWWINVSVFQMVIIRPILMLLAAVMWTDGIYIPGQVYFMGKILSIPSDLISVTFGKNVYK